jgi:ribosome-associated protein
VVIFVREEHGVQERVVRLINAALERKAKDLTLLKVKDFSSLSDYFIICSGSSDRQVRAIADSIEKRLKESGIIPLGIEGKQSGGWVLMDYGDVVVHIFYEPVRKFYNIERLWSDAPRMAVADTITKIDSLNDDM